MFVTSRRRDERPSGGPPARLPAATRAFHWASAALLAAMFGLAWSFNALGPGATGASLVTLHRSVGVALFALVALRLAWRATHPLPPLPAHVTPWERRLAGGVQAALYAGLLAMPAIGWAASDMAGDTVRVFGLFALPSVWPMDEGWSDRLFAVHGWVATALLALVALHVAGALRHRLVKRDGVLERML